MKLPLKWEFPGGKIENNETPEECLVREIWEELKINILPLKKLTPVEHHYDKFSLILIPFVARYLSGEIHLAEHKDYKWLNTKDLGTIDWAQADIPIYKEFMELYSNGTGNI